MCIILVAMDEMMSAKDCNMNLAVIVSYVAQRILRSMLQYMPYIILERAKKRRMPYCSTFLRCRATFSNEG
jgi:hypothetical protein